LPLKQCSNSNEVPLFISLMLASIESKSNESCYRGCPLRLAPHRERSVPRHRFKPTAKCIKVLALVVGNKHGKLTYRESGFDGTCDKYTVNDKDNKCILSAKCLDDRSNWRDTTY
jgi:hypothetical protein